MDTARAPKFYLNAGSRFSSKPPHMSERDHLLIGRYCGCSYAQVAKEDRAYCSWVIGSRSLSRGLMPFKMWLKSTHGGVLPYGKYKNAFFSEIHREHPEYAKHAPGPGGPSCPVVAACSCDRARRSNGKATNKTRACWRSSRPADMPYGGRWAGRAWYAVWCASLDNPSAVMMEFQRYIRDREEEASQEVKHSAPKRARRAPPERQEDARTTACLECRICFDRPVNVLLLPCKHLVMCELCAAMSNKTCPVCRAGVSETLRVYTG